jgi:pimeloyl-ACP methyl ester carboxylesterase
MLRDHLRPRNRTEEDLQEDCVAVCLGGRLDGLDPFAQDRPKRFVTRGAVIGTGSAGVVLDMNQPAVLRAARRLRVGALLITGDQDPFGSYEQSRQLMPVIPVADKRLLVVSGSAHGIQLLGDPNVRADVVGWLREHLS